jgi:hypothetical protein
MIYEAKRSIFICDEYELALLHCFGAIWGRGTNHDGHGFMGWWHRCFPAPFRRLESWSIVQCNSSSRFGGVSITEAFSLGAELDAHGLTIYCVGYP